MTDWSIEGPHFINCNCDFGCPCQYVARPTDGTCKAVVGFLIKEGHYGDTKLDGLEAVNLYSWPNAIHEGNGTMQTVIDEGADEAQRTALAAIMQGADSEPGATMLTIYRAMCSTYIDPLFMKIYMKQDMESRTGSLKIDGLLETTVETLKNPVTGADHRARIDLPMGKEFRIAEVASGTTKASGQVPLDFSNSHAHFVDVCLTSKGVVA